MPIETTEVPDTAVVEETEDLLDDPWQVVVFDDPVNLMGYVALIFKRVFGYPDELAERLMMEVHTKGKSIVWTGVREKAELYVQQLQEYQLLARLVRLD